MQTKPATTMLLPALSALRLSAEHLAALAENGSLYGEDHGQGKTYYRLRFRIGAKQHTRYVGNDQGFVDQVRRELMQLQAKRHSRREMRRLADEGRRTARDKKRLLDPLLASAGRGFHGRAIRQRRISRSVRSVSLE